MRFFPLAYRYSLTTGEIVSKETFGKLFAKIDVKDDYFNSERFAPGSSGESSLLQFLKDQLPFVE